MITISKNGPDMASVTKDRSVKALPPSLRPISYFGSIWELYVLDRKTKVFCRKKPSYIFPWTRDSQCQRSANSLAENTPNASKKSSLICLPKPKSFECLKKSFFWVSVVRGLSPQILVFFTCYSFIFTNKF